MRRRINYIRLHLFFFRLPNDLGVRTEAGGLK